MVSFIAQASKSLSDANITSYDKEYRMLSNLAERNFTYDNKKYRSVEHAYQTLKSGKFDENLYTKYLQADFKNGMGPKLIGRMGTYRPITDGLMKNLIKESLAQNPDKLQLLLKTGNEKLTHQMGNDYWTNRFPEILTELREEQSNISKPKAEKKPQSFETIKKYSVEDVQSNPDKIYIFGDNTEGWGKGGQAIIRDESNAFGISTKDSPREFMSDNNFEANKARIDADIEAIKTDGRPIVFPEDGIGTGRADLKNKAPKTWDYLEEQIKELRSETSNNTSEIKFNKVSESGYPERTKYNAQTSDITFDFSKTSAGSGATKRYAANKWNWVGINNNGLMTGNKNKLANVIAENLLNGKTVNIAGHGNYKSPRGGLTAPVSQLVIDNELIEVMQLANDKIGDKTVTGKIISGGQTGFDEAGVKAANMFGIPTEVNYSGIGLYRDATGTDIDDYQKFTQRFNTFGPRSVGAAQSNLEGQVDNISKKYNLPTGTTKKFLSSFANNVIDPMESIIVKGLTTVGLGALAGPLMTYEISNILLNMFAQGEQSAAKIQLANSSIFGEALGLIKDSSEYTEGLEFEIVMDALEGVVNFSELSPVMYAEDKALQVPTIRKGVDTVMEPVSEVYNTSKDYLKTGMSSVLGAFKGE